MTRRRLAWATWDWGWLTVMAAAVAFRLPHWTDRSLWYDESSSWQTAKFPFPEMMQSIRLNVHLPLYYTLLKGWMAIWGESVASLRGFSIAFGVLTVAGMDLFARELYRASSSGDDQEQNARRFARVVAGLVAVSPFQIFASIEARMYSLGTTLAAFSSWLLLRILRERGTSRLWWAYGATAAGLLYTHHYGLFTVAAQYLFLALYLVWLLGAGARAEARAVFAGAAVVGLAVAIVYLPGLALLRIQTGRVRQDYWIPEMTWRIFSGTFSQFLIPTHGFDFLIGGWVVFAVLALACGLVAMGGRRGDGLVLASAIVPMLGSAAISTVQPIWLHRYFLFAQLFFLTAMALAVWKVTRRVVVLRWVLVTLLFAILVGANVAFWKYLDIPHGTGVRGAVEMILAKRRDDEIIVTPDHHQYFPLKYYLGGRATVRLLQPDPDLFWGPHLIRPGDLITTDQLDDALCRGVWLVGRLPTPEITPKLAKARLLERSEFRYYHSLHRRLFVHHYRTRDEAARKERPAP